MPHDCSKLQDEILFLSEYGKLELFYSLTNGLVYRPTNTE